MLGLKLNHVSKRGPRRVYLWISANAELMSRNPSRDTFMPNHCIDLSSARRAGGTQTKFMATVMVKVKKTVMVKFDAYRSIDTFCLVSWQSDHSPWYLANLIFGLDNSRSMLWTKATKILSQVICGSGPSTLPKIKGMTKVVNFCEAN